VTYYNKLVRDRIPEIIRADGKSCEVRTLAQDEYLAKLNEKLREELAEYGASGDIGELADLVDVVAAIVECGGLSTEEFEGIRQAKRTERGGFQCRLLLVSVAD
jgi:predicted house-cleaning noncanonical NTP pyrophosphatase (MazG superfamily)